MEVDDAITKVEMVDDGEWPSSKELTIEGEAQDIEVKEPTPEKKSTPVNSKMETRSMSRTSSPLTPLEVILSSLGMMKCLPQKSHHQE